MRWPFFSCEGNLTPLPLGKLWYSVFVNRNQTYLNTHSHAIRAALEKIVPSCDQVAAETPKPASLPGSFSQRNEIRGFGMVDISAIYPI